MPAEAGLPLATSWPYLRGKYDEAGRFACSGWHNESERALLWTRRTILLRYQQFKGLNAQSVSDTFQVIQRDVPSLSLDMRYERAMEPRF